MSNVISLKKGDVINLSKSPVININKGLSQVTVGLGWDPVKQKKGLFGGFTTPDIDCDAFISCPEVNSKDNLIYYGCLKNNDGSIYHTGDNLTGDGDGDDEALIVDLNRVKCNRLVVGVNIYNAHSRKQHFGMLENAFVRIVDNNTHTEMCRYTLDNQYAGKTAIIFGELVRTDGVWNFRAVGEAFDSENISATLKAYL